MLLRLRRRIQREFTRLAPVYTRLAAHRAQREIRELVAWIRPRRDERALDVACGPGTLARALAPLTARVCGLDLCPKMVQAASSIRGRAPSPPIFVVGDSAHLPCRSRCFDLVTCTYSFANFRDPLGVLREFARVSTAGGRMVVADVLAPEDPAQCEYLNRLEALRGHFYTRVLTQREFLELFREARLEPETSRIQSRRRSFREWLRLSPAAAQPERARRLRRLLLESIDGDQAGLHPRRIASGIVFHHTTGWFLLRRR